MYTQRMYPKTSKNISFTISGVISSIPISLRSMSDLNSTLLIVGLFSSSL